MNETIQAYQKLRLHQLELEAHRLVLKSDLKDSGWPSERDFLRKKIQLIERQIKTAKAQTTKLRKGIENVVNNNK